MHVFRVLNTNLMHKIMFIIVELFPDVHICCDMFAYKFHEDLIMFESQKHDENTTYTKNMRIWKFGSQSTATVDRVQDRDLGSLWSPSRSTATVDRQLVWLCMIILYGFGLSNRFLDLMMIDYDISDC